jgi:hypothetical protein
VCGWPPSRPKRSTRSAPRRRSKSTRRGGIGGWFGCWCAA